MRKSNKFLIYALVFLLAINLTALLTLAYNRLLFQKSPSPEPAQTESSLQEELNLTPQQHERLKAHRKAYKQEIQPTVQEIQEKDKLLLEEIQSEKPNLKRIYALVDEISQLQAEIQKEAVKKLLQEKSILNPEQRKHYFSVFEQHVCGRGMGPHHHSGENSAPKERKKKEKESCINQMVHQ
ncbi:periplasmic heavy metal sensor [bacterium]|nr:periplasmic heavy metal sensor [bacterium]